MKSWLFYLVRVLLLGLVMFGLAAMPAALQAQSGQAALVLTMDGPLTPAFMAYLERGLARAAEQGAPLLLLRLNTPGGQVDLMEDMMAAIRNSSVPVVVYVAPRGATAGSAGTVITLAGHASAMAPETAIGAASPVGSQGEDMGETLEAKLKEILRAHVRNLAARRGPEAIALAEATIESAQAATAEEAYAVGLVDFLARDDADLLEQLNGFTVEVNGQPRVLQTSGVGLESLPINLLETVLNLLTNPNVVFLLLALGAQAILIELSSPGGWVAGFLGVVALALAFYGLGVLPVNWFGLVFILTAFVLFILEVKAPTHGGLTVAGAGCLVVGALVLFNSPGTPSFLRVNVPLVVGTSVVLAAGFLALVMVALRAQHRPPVMGVEGLVGQQGEARSTDTVQVAGELWSAEMIEGQLTPGQKIVVQAVKGLRLVVRKK